MSEMSGDFDPKDLRFEPHELESFRRALLASQPIRLDDTALVAILCSAFPWLDRDGCHDVEATVSNAIGALAEIRRQLSGDKNDI